MKLSESQVQKIKTYVGFAFKSGTLIIGTDNILSAKRYYAVLCDSSLSGNALEKIQRHAGEKNTKVLVIENLSEASPRQGIKALAIKNPQLAKATIETLGDEE